MHVFILGYGYAAYYCAQKLLARGIQVTAISRTYPKKYQLNGLIHQINTLPELSVSVKPDALLYCAPPPKTGAKDHLLSETLDKLEKLNCVSPIVYWGSSGVYGDHLGHWVDESSPCHIKSDIQRRRLDAEKSIRLFSQKHHVSHAIMRVAGMFGPDRLAIADTTVIKEEEAPYTNLIFIKDAAEIAVTLLLSQKDIGIINVSDGQPRKAGAVQKAIAAHQGIALKEEPFQSIMATASPMRHYFLSASKRLSTKKCRALFPDMLFSDLTKEIIQCLKK